MAPSYSKQLESPWLSGTWRKRDVLWWVGLTTAVPVLGRATWWAREKSYNSLTPYQVRTSSAVAVCYAWEDHVNIWRAIQWAMEQH